MGTTRTIELRKITYSAALSEETSAYAAQVWVDGIHVCDVQNQGHGGCDMQHPAKGKTHADIDELNAYIKATYPKNSYEAGGERHEYDADLETVCGDLLATHLIERDLKRLLNRTVAFYDPATKQVRSYKGKWQGDARAALIEKLQKQTPTAKVLNVLPFADALELFRSAA